VHEVRRESITTEARTLVWLKDQLYDIAAGWRPVGGQSTFASYGKYFDTAVAAPNGDFVALMASPHTMALLLEPPGVPVRQVNRGYYAAEAFRYPLALFTLPDGRTGVVHCPEFRNELQIEVAATGERLTGGDRAPNDFFHSRLAVSPSGRYLLSAGWWWGPFSSVGIYDLHQALVGSATLDQWTSDDVFEGRELGDFEVGGACFVGDDVVLSTTEPTLFRWDLATRTAVWTRELELCAGDLMPFHGNVLAVHEHPVLYDGTNGERLAAWPDLPTGESCSPIVYDKTFTGPNRIAVDPLSPRFAHTDGETVTIVHLGR
jgi:hypothetical protein